MAILLPDVWAVPEPRQYKVHFARWNGHHQPLEVWTRDEQEWQGWQEFWPGRDDFNRPYIFSLMQFYHETDTWLFGGVYRVTERRSNAYGVELTEQGEGFIGRMKLRSSYRSRPTRVNFENHSDQFEVKEILPERYSGRSFPGYEDIDLSFEELETLTKNERPEWKGALENVKGIYLITDTTTGKRYVGSAYGDFGIWSRWCAYISSGHGGNTELRQLAADPTLDYCRKAFRFALLEHRPMMTSDEKISSRESHWKRILLSRGEFGLNRN